MRSTVTRVRRKHKHCPLRRVLQKGLGRSAEQNRGLVGDIRLKSGPYLVLFVLLHGGRPGSGRPKTFLENILPQERYQLVADVSLQYQAQERSVPGSVRTAIWRETWLGPTKDFSRKYIATREISTCRGRQSAVFIMYYANAHAAIGQPTCTELARGA